MNELVWREVPNSRGVLLEGPTWIEGANAFQWVDILESEIFRWEPYSSEGAQRRRLPLDYVTAAIPLDHETSVLSSGSALHNYSWTTGTLTQLGSWEFPEGVRFNDGALSPDGVLHIGTMSSLRRPGDGKLFRFHQNILEPIIHNIGISNGIGWTSPQRAIYVDSLKPTICWFDTTASTPKLRPFFQLPAESEPDGLTITPEGKVLVALWEGQGLIEIDADGASSKFIAVPDISPTSVCVGGTDPAILVVTTARDLQGNGGRVLYSTEYSCERD